MTCKDRVPPVRPYTQTDPSLAICTLPCRLLPSAAAVACERMVLLAGAQTSGGRSYMQMYAPSTRVKQSIEEHERNREVERVVCFASPIFSVSRLSSTVRRKRLLLQQRQEHRFQYLADCLAHFAVSPADTKYSAFNFLVATLLFLPWLMTFSIGEPVTLPCRQAALYGYAYFYSHIRSTHMWVYLASGGPRVVGQGFFDSWNVGSLDFEIPL